MSVIDTSASFRCRVYGVGDCCEDHRQRIDALEADEANAFPVAVRWQDDAEWDLFSELLVSPSDNTILLTGSEGVGRAEGSGGTHGNDRRIYTLDALDGVSDAEIYMDFTLEDQGAQTGLAFRVGADTAVVAWNNIFLTADALLIGGVWEFPGNNLAATNQFGPQLNAAALPILDAEGDGYEVIVRTTVPHLLEPGQLVNFDFGPFDVADQQTVTDVDDAFTFAAASTESGMWTTGFVRLNTVPLPKTNPDDFRRRMAARLIGNRLTWKQWFAREVEPSWSDPLRSATAELPATLAGSGLLPPSAGRVGVIINHMSSDRVLTVNDLEIFVVR